MHLHPELQRALAETKIGETTTPPRPDDPASREQAATRTRSVRLRLRPGRFYATAQRLGR